MKLIINNSLTQIKFNNSEKARERNNILKSLNIKLNPLQPYRYKVKSFRMHAWDGREHIVNLSSGKFPTGMLKDVLKVLRNERNYYPNLEIRTVDHRTPPIKVEIPPKMKIGGHYLRDYQIKGIKEAIKYQRVIINSATNSGKTSIAVGITKMALNALASTDNILLFTQSKDVTQQDQQSFKRDLGIPIGMLGGGHHTTAQVTCATARTLSSALKRPDKDVKLTSRKDKVLQYMHDKYVPLFLGRYNKGSFIKAFINTHKPRYSYDANCFEQLAYLSSLPENKITDALTDYNTEYKKLIRKKNKKQFDKYEHMKQFLSSVKVVFVDEAQHAPSKSFRKVLSNIPNARLRVALTGTVPTDKIKHAYFVAEFGHHIMKVTNHQLIKRGISATPWVTKIPITRCSHINPKTGKEEYINLDEFCSRLIPVDVKKSDISLVMYKFQYEFGVIQNIYRNKVIANVANTLYQSHNGVTLIVVSSIPQGNAIQKELAKRNKNISVYFLQGSDDLDTRTKVLNKVKHNQIQVLIASQVINEGLNIPNLANMIYASAGKSPVELLQRVGRLLRKYPNQKYVFIFDIMDKTSDILFNQAEQRLKIYAEQQFKIMN